MIAMWVWSGADPESHCFSNAPDCDLDDQAAVSPGFVAMTSLWYKKDERESAFSSPFLTLSLRLSPWIQLIPIADVHPDMGYYRGYPAGDLVRSDRSQSGYGCFVGLLT